LKISLSIAGITESGLVDELTAAYPQITSITLFGSVAKGTDNPSSDIDILIISRKPIRLKPLAAEKRLERELSVVKYVHPDWRKKAKIDKAFYDGVIIEGMSLYGELPVVK